MLISGHRHFDGWPESVNYNQHRRCDSGDLGRKVSGSYHFFVSFCIFLGGDPPDSMANVSSCCPHGRSDGLNKTSADFVSDPSNSSRDDRRDDCQKTSSQSTSGDKHDRRPSLRHIGFMNTRSNSTEVGADCAVPMQCCDLLLTNWLQELDMMSSLAERPILQGVKQHANKAWEGTDINAPSHFASFGWVYNVDLIS